MAEIRDNEQISDTAPAVRKPWVTPKVIVSEARNTNKNFVFKFETTIGPTTFGPS